MNDTISKQTAIDVAFDIYPDDEYFREQFVKRIMALPSAQPQKMKGKWIDCKSSPHWKCSHCGYRAPYFGFEPDDMSEWLSEFCPHCGADMRGESDAIN